jgi:hypothetical protein
MMYYGPLETWKVVYHPKDSSNMSLGTAFVEADCHQSAMQAFREQYAGQYFTIKSCQKLLG